MTGGGKDGATSTSGGAGTSADPGKENNNKASENEGPKKRGRGRPPKPKGPTQEENNPDVSTQDQSQASPGKKSKGKGGGSKGSKRSKKKDNDRDPLIPNLDSDCEEAQEEFEKSAPSDAEVKAFMGTNLYQALMAQNNDDNNEIANKFNILAQDVNTASKDIAKICRGIAYRKKALAKGFVDFRKLIDKNTAGIEANKKAIDKVEKKVTSHTAYRVRQLHIDIAERDASDKELFISSINKEESLEEASRAMNKILHPRIEGDMRFFGQWLICYKYNILTPEELPLRKINGGYWLSAPNRDGSHKFILKLVSVGMRDEILNEYKDKNLENNFKISISHSQRDRNHYKAVKQEAEAKQKQDPQGSYGVKTTCPGLYRCVDKNKVRPGSSQGQGGSSASSSSSQSSQNNQSTKNSDPNKTESNVEFPPPSVAMAEHPDIQPDQAKSARSNSILSDASTKSIEQIAPSSESNSGSTQGQGKNQSN